MQYENFFSVGEKLEIELEQKYEMPRVLKSQLLEIAQASESEYYVSIPMEKGKMMPISVGKYIQVYYAVESKGVFCFRAVVTGRAKDPVLHLKIRQVGEMQKIQRRNFFRLDILLPVEVFDSEKNLISVGATKDISGGGARFTLPQRLEKGEEIYMNVTIEGCKYLIKGSVLRSIGIYENATEYEIAVKFTQMNEDDRNEIIKYLFKHQRILRQKGLI